MPMQSMHKDTRSATNGMDTLFVTNYLSHVLITEKVLPMLNRSKIEIKIV